MSMFGKTDKGGNIMNFRVPTFFQTANDEDVEKINGQIKENFLSTINWDEIDLFQSKWNPAIDTAYTTLGTDIMNLIDHYGLEHLKDFIFKNVQDFLEYTEWTYEDLFIDQSWSVFGAKGNVQGPHTHGYASENSQIAGTYYVDVKQDPNGGRLHIEAPYSPKTGVTFPFGPKSQTYYAFDPVPGRIILFPAWMTHWVSPIYLEDYVRISIAFNITAYHGRPGRNTHGSGELKDQITHA